MVNEFLEWQCFREISSNEVCTTCVHNRSDSYLTVLVLIEALIVVDGGLFFVRQNPAVI